MIIIGGILVLFICITRLASNEIFSSSNKIHQEVGRAKDLSAPLYKNIVNTSTHITKTPTYTHTHTHTHTLQSKLKQLQYKIQPYEIVTV